MKKKSKPEIVNFRQKVKKNIKKANPYNDFIKQKRKENPKMSFKDISEQWKKSKGVNSEIHNNDNNIITEPIVASDKGTTATETLNEVSTTETPKTNIEVLPQQDLSIISSTANLQNPQKSSEKEDSKDDIFGDDEDEKADELGQPVGSFANMPVQDRYKIVTKAVHRTLNNIIKLTSNNKVSISKEDMEDLNESGAQLLQKYDKKGQISEYSPEIGYILTITGVVGEMILVKELEKKRQKEQNPPQETPQTTTQQAPFK